MSDKLYGKGWTIKDFEVGKFYKFVGTNDDSYYMSEKMKVVFDGKPRKCIMTGDDSQTALFDHMGKHKLKIIWYWYFDTFEECTEEEYKDAWNISKETVVVPKLEIENLKKWQKEAIPFIEAVFDHLSEYAIGDDDYYTVLHLIEEAKEMQTL